MFRWLRVGLLVSLALPLASQGTVQLPANWTMKQWVGSDTWTWTMTRTAPDTWRAAVRHDQTGQQGVEAFTLTESDGSRITLLRAGTGTYKGTIAADGKSMSGVCSFIGGGWSASWDSPILPGSTNRPSTTTPPATGPLPAQFTMKQWSGSESWTWTMNRTSANNWAATVRQDQTGQQGSGNFTLTRVEGNRITMNRANTGTYQGVIAADGKSISGTCDFIGGGWSIALTGATGTVAPPPPAAAAAVPGSSLVVIYPGPCTAIWTQNKPGVFDALTICQGPATASFRETLTVESFDGAVMVIHRPGLGRYRGTLSADRKTIRGSCDWAGCGPNYRWTAYIDRNWNDDPPLR